ncbi:Helix-turn-helix domain containing protein [uncultured Caudovirales phage]|uniref:Helix-turn-helix domain containing protein n=1 Tax=uncultured Caudovirales phage TaxID=2100421 RepID=A0A6J5L3P3_9CAUD|nr:Helix-turn-helix domain containing protein [uncultured Caudovirales phage]
MSPQAQKLLKYLKKHKKIQPLEALKELGIYRLSARILDLRNDGISITTNRIQVKNRQKEICVVAEYKLEAR